MKKNLIFVLVFSLIVFVSCVKKESAPDYDEEKQTIEDGIEFHANYGIIMPMLLEDDKSLIKKRSISIAEGELGDNLITDKFEIAKGGDFYYPIAIENLDESFLPDTAGIPYEIIVGREAGIIIETRKEQLKSYDFKEISIPKEKKLTVFSFVNKVLADELEGEAPAMAISMHADYLANAYFYGFEGGSFSSNMATLDTFIPNKLRAERSQDIIAFDGDYPNDFNIRGYENGACDKRIDGIDVEVEKTEMTSHELALMIMEERIDDLDNNSIFKSDKKKKLRVLNRTLEVFENRKSARSWDRRMEEKIMSDLSVSRIFYLKFDMPDNSILEINRKAGNSYNFYHAGKNDDLMEYCLLASPYDTDLVIDIDINTLGVLEDRRLSQTDDLSKKKWEVPVNKDFELVFSRKKF